MMSHCRGARPSGGCIDHGGGPGRRAAEGPRPRMTIDKQFLPVHLLHLSRHAPGIQMKTLFTLLILRPEPTYQNVSSGPGPAGRWPIKPSQSRQCAAAPARPAVQAYWPSEAPASQAEWRPRQGLGPVGPGRRCRLRLRRSAPAAAAAVTAAVARRCQWHPRRPGPGPGVWPQPQPWQPRTHDPSQVFPKGRIIRTCRTAAQAGKLVSLISSIFRPRPVVASPAGPG